MGSQSGMVNAWCGGWVWNGKFYVHGGGHADYGGNETGVIDLRSESPTWGLLAERSPVGALLGGSNYYSDGKPTSRHTYYAMHPVIDGTTPKMLRLNANMGFSYNGPPVGGSADVRTTAVDALNLVTGDWETGVAAMPRITGSETSSAQHPITGDIYVWHSDNVIEMLDVSAGSSSQIAAVGGTEGAGGALVVDAANGRIVRFGGRSATRAVYWPMGGGVKTELSLTGPAAAAVSALSGPGIGVAHDTGRNAVYLYTTTPLIYRVDLDTLDAVEVTQTGQPLGAQTNGWWGRVRYVREIDAVVSISSWTAPVQIMRCGAA